MFPLARCNLNRIIMAELSESRNHSIQPKDAAKLSPWPMGIDSLWLRDRRGRTAHDVLRNLVSRIRALAAALVTISLWFSVAWGQSTARIPALAKADWSVNAARNLASAPPELNAVEDFTGRAVGESEENPPVDVCEFRFADLRNSGNLSLILSVAPGSWGCTELYIFDKTPKGFETYRANARGHDLAHSVLDLNHDGRHELVLWADLAPFATGTAFGQLGCNSAWPLIFAWTGNAYSDVSDQYKDYHAGYLKTVNTRLAAYSSALAAAAAPKVNHMLGVGGGTAEQTLGEPSPAVATEVNAAVVGIGAPFSAPTHESAVPVGAARDEAGRNYPCTEIGAAKAQAFLGIQSDSIMTAAVKNSESDDPDKRITAAVVFSYLGTQEAEQDLRKLGNDADPRVAAIAKTAASFGEDPPPGARAMRRQDTYLKLPEPRQSRR